MMTAVTEPVIITSYGTDYEYGILDNTVRALP